MEKRTLKLQEARTMRALAHPLRLRLLGLLRTEGPATATMLCDEVDEAPSLVSYHLRKLAEHGFIEEAPELARDARERWWRSSHERTSWSTAEFLDDPERWAAASALQRQVLQRYDERLEQFLTEQASWGREWAKAAESSDVLLRLSPAQLRRMLEEVFAILDRYEALEPEEGAERVSVIIHAFPIRTAAR